jgi:tRNA(His) 5'-end guanylyltransferase
MPLIIRLDGCHFHTLLRKAQKPYDPVVMQCMIEAATEVLKTIGGTARFAYIQSDEVSIAINSYQELNSEPWFANNLQKITTVAASTMSVAFSKAFGKDAVFDARAFILPEAEINNYFLWRQLDAARNSIQQYGRFFVSSKEMHGKSNKEVQEMMFSKHDFNWNNAPVWTKRGVVIPFEESDYTYSVAKNEYNQCPSFGAEPEYLENLFFNKSE